jgi:APA family basic amino acid/polyamine antiporter
MASQVLYGLAAQGSLHKKLAIIHPVTRMPLAATTLVVAIVVGLALFIPIGDLAKFTSQLALIVFTGVNLALVRLKLSGPAPIDDIFQVPSWVPVCGFFSCLLLLLSGFI